MHLTNFYKLVTHRLEMTNFDKFVVTQDNKKQPITSNDKFR
jgi:hypothetical protein